MGSDLTLGVSGWRLHGQRTGVGRYLVNLVENWTPEPAAKGFSDITLYVPRSLDRKGISLPENILEKVIESDLPMLAWENLRLGPAAPDTVVFYPSFSRPFVTRGASVVVTHDATMRVVPEMFSRRDRLVYDPLYGWSARAATLVITTSGAARDDIVKAWNVDPDKIRVTHMAAAAAFHPLAAAVDRARLRERLLGDDTPYFMFVGKVSGRRNIPQLLKAFEVFKRQGHPQKLLIVGPDRAVAEALGFAAEAGVGEHLLTRSYVRDDVLNQLYNCADAFVMPSAYENGSLPVFEAQAAGTAVISVDTAGTREITGGEALLIPKLEIGELVDAMTHLATDADARIRFAERGLANSRRFSWQKCASETLAICREAAEIATTGR